MCRGEGSQGRPWGSPSAEVCRLRPVDGLMQLPALSPLQDPTLHCARPSLQCPSSRDSGMLFRIKPAYPRVTADSAGTMTCLPDTILQLGKLRPILSPATPPPPCIAHCKESPEGNLGVLLSIPGQTLPHRPPHKSHQGSELSPAPETSAPPGLQGFPLALLQPGASPGQAWTTLPGAWTQ